MRTLALLAIAAAAIGCGSQASPTSNANTTSSPPSTASTSASSTRPLARLLQRRGPKVLRRAPLVIVGEGVNGIDIYVRTTRTLPRTGNHVTVDGEGGDLLTFADVPRCYEVIASKDVDPEPGDTVEVKVTMPAKSGDGSERWRVRTRERIPEMPGDDGYEAPYLRALGCAPGR